MSQFGCGFPALGAILVGAVALGVGVAANSRVKARRASSRGLAITGIGPGCVTTLGGILLLVLAMLAVV
jgi:hypothetical protein